MTNLATERRRFYGMLRQLEGLPNDPAGSLPDPATYWGGGGTQNHDVHFSASVRRTQWQAEVAESGLRYGGVRSTEGQSHNGYYWCGPVAAFMAGLKMAKSEVNRRAIRDYLAQHWMLAALMSIKVPRRVVEVRHWRPEEYRPLDDVPVTVAASGARWKWHRDQAYVKVMPVGWALAWAGSIGGRRARSTYWDPRVPPHNGRRPWWQEVMGACVNRRSYHQNSAPEPWGLSPTVRYSINRTILHGSRPHVFDLVQRLNAGGAVIYRDGARSAEMRIRRTTLGVETATIKLGKPHTGPVACQVAQATYDGRLMYATACSNRVGVAGAPPNLGWDVQHDAGRWVCRGDGPQSPVIVKELPGEVLYDLYVGPSGVEILHLAGGPW